MNGKRETDLATFWSFCVKSTWQRQAHRDKPSRPCRGELGIFRIRGSQRRPHRDKPSRACRGRRVGIWILSVFSEFLHGILRGKTRVLVYYVFTEFLERSREKRTEQAWRWRRKSYWAIVHHCFHLVSSELFYFYVYVFHWHG